MADRYRAEITENLSSLTRQLTDMGARPRALLTTAGNTLRNLITIGFRTGTDPYGNTWVRGKKKEGDTLIEIGRLRGSFIRAPLTDDQQVEVGTKVIYAPVHQHGSTIIYPVRAGIREKSYEVKMPQRMMVPTNARGLPDKWRAKLQKNMIDRWKREIKVPPPTRTTT